MAHYDRKSGFADVVICLLQWILRGETGMASEGDDLNQEHSQETSTPTHAVGSERLPQLGVTSVYPNTPPVIWMVDYEVLIRAGEYVYGKVLKGIEHAVRNILRWGGQDAREEADRDIERGVTV
ncbi:hypothetical protein NLJ89_g9615 [Agrocybe chaxingu]|uniref:Uncharacterized protein n=1 Tax=Agrocybe chaxingu TaxID=84603 RepID=A0A9W8JSC9_9AGAR|nr:hypothetical protein NLJ89_g9615 [Agrocybe chaxingu]